MSARQQCKNVWSIILAGGRGERLTTFVKRTLGHTRPKQFCTFVGTRSMLEHTLDRADEISAPQQKVTVLAERHYQAGWAQMVVDRPGKVVVQPQERDTAAAVFVALTYVRAYDPDALLVICPSDHFIYPESQFCEEALNAVKAAQEINRLIVLLGVQPDRSETEYGWIEPGTVLGWSNGCDIREVTTFVEKPSREACETALANGCLWNTSIIATTAGRLWAAGWLCFPETMTLFKEYEPWIGSPWEKTKLRELYEKLPSFNLSRDLLQRAVQHIAVMELNSVVWSDWGKAERIVETLRRIGRRPAFSLTHAAAG
jgi:mannose-1-phosphate guanylyltransferase